MSHYMFNIPNHKNCTNCGECCGPVGLTRTEWETVKNYLKIHPESVAVKKTPKSSLIVCSYRDEQRKCCSIYPVRPLICRLFGVTARLVCPNGNSGNISVTAMFASQMANEDEKVFVSLQSGNEFVI